MSESQHIKDIKAYFNSDAAQAFHQLVWGGDDIHVGLYDDPSLTIRAASRETTKKMVAMLPSSVDGNTRILDIGAGFGGAARYINWHYGSKIDCLDISVKQNEYNLKKVTRAGQDQLIRVIEGNYEDLPFEDNSYDMVWSNDALMHAENREKALEEIQRVLRFGGWLIFSDVLHGENAARGSLKPILERLPIKDLQTLKDYQRLLKKVGFEEEQILELPQHLHTHYQRIQKNFKAEKKQLSDINGEDFYKKTLKSLSLWVRGAKKGYLSWGIFLYRNRAK